MPAIGAVVIGRNEGERLVACLQSLKHLSPRLVYVDSGSTDTSVQAASSVGAHVVQLDMAQPFTAARARNAGWKRLIEQHPDTALVQFVDGDCEVVGGWLEAATAFLAENPAYAVACGRRRERFPEKSVYNLLCDIEWNTPVGDALACGGDALVRSQALALTGGYRDDLIAGEEPEWCVRLRDAGYKIRRLPHDMTLHDAAMHQFRQWWQRTKRAGFAFAAGAALHGAPPHFHWVAETRRALTWGLALPAMAMIVAMAWPPALLVLPMMYAMQMLRLRGKGMGWAQAGFLTIGKLAEAQGVVKFHWERLRGQRSHIIEYK
jgi:GT2 family glycosyltransferase